MVRKIVVGSDHGGFLLKERIKKLLEEKRYRVEDVGAWSGESCDYPRIGYEAAKKVAEGKVRRGILICKTGTGMGVVANKLPGVRAGVCLTEADAVSARQHNDTNMLVLAASRTAYTKAVKIVNAWLDTGPLKGRHARRVRQITDLEKKVFKKRI